MVAIVRARRSSRLPLAGGSSPITTTAPEAFASVVIALILLR